VTCETLEDIPERPNGCPDPTTAHVSTHASPSFPSPDRFALRRRDLCLLGRSTRVLFGDLRTLTLGQDADRALLTAVDQAGNVSSSAAWQKP